jgi:DNA-directed RNA polymerase subunit RPC12/RpoP
VSEIKAFFRHCPSCGRRFHIRLVRKEQVAGDTIKEQLTSAEEEMGSGMMHANPTLTPLAEGRPVYVDIEEFDYTYKCTHCGHQWSEVHEEEESVGT